MSSIKFSLDFICYHQFVLFLISQYHQLNLDMIGDEFLFSMRSRLFLESHHQTYQTYLITGIKQKQKKKKHTSGSSCLHVRFYLDTHSISFYDLYLHHDWCLTDNLVAHLETSGVALSAQDFLVKSMTSWPGEARCL